MFEQFHIALPRIIAKPNNAVTIMLEPGLKLCLKAVRIQELVRECYHSRQLISGDHICVEISRWNNSGKLQL